MLGQHSNTDAEFEMNCKEKPLPTAEKPLRPAPPISCSTRTTSISAPIFVQEVADEKENNISMCTVALTEGHSEVNT